MENPLNTFNTTGWKCPVCNTGNSPHITYCPTCRDNTAKTTAKVEGQKLFPTTNPVPDYDKLLRDLKKNYIPPNPPWPNRTYWEVEPIVGPIRGATEHLYPLGYPSIKSPQLPL